MTEQEKSKQSNHVGATQDEDRDLENQDAEISKEGAAGLTEAQADKSEMVLADLRQQSSLEEPRLLIVGSMAQSATSGLGGRREEVQPPSQFQISNTAKPADLKLFPPSSGNLEKSGNIKGHNNSNNASMTEQ